MSIIYIILSCVTILKNIYFKEAIFEKKNTLYICKTGINKKAPHKKMVNKNNNHESEI